MLRIFCYGLKVRRDNGTDLIAKVFPSTVSKETGKLNSPWLPAGLLAIFIFGGHLASSMSIQNPLHTLFAMMPVPLLIGFAVWVSGIHARRIISKESLILNFGAVFLLLFGSISLMNLGRSGEGVPASSDFKVMTFNVHFGSRKTPDVLQLIRSENPDIVLLQENFGDQDSPANFVQFNLPGWHLVRFKGAATLTKYPILSTEGISLNDQRFHGLLVTVLQTPRGKLRVINAHWSAPQSARGWNPIQSASVVKLQELTTTLRTIKSSDLPTLLAGDLNTPPTHHAIKRLSADLESSFEAKGVGPGWSFPSGMPMVRIDHIFLSGQLKTTQCRLGPKLGSDHLPLFSEIRFVQD
jgi:endonuclease/exonuclease/phosphatase (EEP) superfamily protein YafD